MRMYAVFKRTVRYALLPTHALAQAWADEHIGPEATIEEGREVSADIAPCRGELEALDRALAARTQHQAELDCSAPEARLAS